MQMKDEAVIVAGVLAEFNAPCYILKRHSYQTARHNVYGLQRQPGIKISKVWDLTDEIDEALTDALGRPVHVRFLRAPLAIAIPREQPAQVLIRHLLPGIQKTDDNHLYVMFGQHYDHSSLSRGERVEPVALVVDLKDPATPHALIGGTTGAGKTIVIKNLLLSACVGRSPANLSVVIIDPKGQDFTTMYDLPHLAHPVVTKPEDFTPVLNAVIAEMDRRSTMLDRLTAQYDPVRALQMLPKHIGPNLLIVVDEVADLIASAGKPGQEAIQRLTQKGRGLGIHVILGTQQPKASFMGGLTKANVPVRACGAVAEMEDGKLVTGIKGSELLAHRLLGDGDFLLTFNGTRIMPYQSGYIEDGEDSRIINKLADWWNGVRSTFTLRIDAPVQKTTLVPDADNTDYAEPQGPAMKREAINAVHDQMITGIVGFYEDQGVWPSSYKVQQLFQEQYGRSLNPKTASKLLYMARTGERVY